jgi:hypothetical protein
MDGDSAAVAVAATILVVVRRVEVAAEMVVDDASRTR